MSDLLKKFEDIYGTGGQIQKFFSPGRVNLIGEHIDYNGGFVFPGALTIGITALVRFREDTLVKLSSENAAGQIVLDLAGPIEYTEKDGWGNYAKGVLKYLIEEGYQFRGAEILLSSNLPDGAGLSSSAALEVLIGYIFVKSTGAEPDRVWLARLAQRAENEFVGVNCGIMDQFSVAVGKAGNAILLDCDSLKYELVPLDLKDYLLVIMNTNKRRELADSKYNERRAECEKALEIINSKAAAGVPNLCAADISDLDLIDDAVIKKRARHVITENLRVKEATEVLKAGNIKRFGELMSASHYSLQHDYEVTGKELDAIAEASQNHLACIGARMTGAGFGGCAIALVHKSSLEDFTATVAQKYKQATGLTPAFYPSQIGEGVHFVKA